ncbi:MAG: hypothetical protein HKN56_05270 [Gammaproteobacteria bacterium]|nr:hypothetical protein [Gammaproteobacteria bacterium]NND54366.1 hypothetical protein [Gammaproteobacteria bacterium]
MPTIAEVIEIHLDRLFGLEDVAGVAEGQLDGEPCIKIYLVQENTRTVLELPGELEGYPLVTEITGSFTKG